MSSALAALQAGFALQLKLQGQDLVFRDGTVRALLDENVPPQDTEPRGNFDERINHIVVIPRPTDRQLPKPGEHFITPRSVLLRIQEVQPLDEKVRCFCSGSDMEPL